MKPELWFNRADHELSLAKELLEAGTLLWAASYAHRSVEYALEGLIVMKTGERPERGSRLADLQASAKIFLPDAISSIVDDLVKISPLVWQSDLSADQVSSITDSRTRGFIAGADQILTWIGEEWENRIETDGNPAIEG